MKMYPKLFLVPTMLMLAVCLRLNAAEDAVLAEIKAIQKANDISLRMQDRMDELLRTNPMIEEQLKREDPEAIDLFVQTVFSPEVQRVVEEEQPTPNIAEYPDITAAEAAANALSVLMGHHHRAGAQSTLQQLPPPELQEVAQLVKKSNKPEGKRIFLDLKDYANRIPPRKFSLKLMTFDDDTFADLTNRLRAFFKIPAHRQIIYFFGEKIFGPSANNYKILDFVPRDQYEPLNIRIAP